MSFRISRNWIHSRIRLLALFSLLLLSLGLVIGALAEKRADALVTTSQGPRQSSPIALSTDDRTLINVNPEANSITKFDVSTDTPVKLAEIGVGVDPQSVAIHPDGTKAYVANAYDGTVSVVNLASNCVSSDIKVGTEPMALALSPNGRRLYVANSASNNLSIVDTALPTPSVVGTIDLSSFGKAPRAIAVTNDGDTDDIDETIFVAFFFSQLGPGKTAADEGLGIAADEIPDISDEALYFSVFDPEFGSANPGSISLGPMANTGFNSNGALAPATGQVPFIASTNPETFTTPTGAFPNQLASIAIHPNQPRAYVVSTGASPNGPLRFNSNAQGLVSVFDTTSKMEVIAGQTDTIVRRTAPLNLNQGVNLDSVTFPRLFNTNPVAMAWRPNGSDAWVAVQQADTIVRLSTDASGIPTIGAPLVNGPGQIVRVDLQNTAMGQIPGKAPRGIAINGTGTRAYVFNYISRSITAVDISNSMNPSIVSTAQSSALPNPGTPEETAQLGQELFHSGRGPDGRMSQNAWGSCAICHPNGRSDNVTWMFPSGPRQTIPLDGTFDKTTHDKRILSYSAIFDEVQDFEMNIRDLSGGRGLIDDDRVILAIGGANGSTPTDLPLIEQFNSFTGVVGTTNDLASGAPLPTLTNGRRDFGIATLDDGRVFIIGGRNGPGDGSLVSEEDAVLEFNPRTNVLRRRRSTGFRRRHSLRAAVVRTNAGFRVYAIGGYSGTSTGTLPIGDVEEYNPLSDTWRSVGSMPVAAAQFGIAVAGGVNTDEPHQIIHVVSGNAGSESSPTLTPGVQLFKADPNGPGTWTTSSVPGLTPRRNHGCVLVFRNVDIAVRNASRVINMGGQNASGEVLSTVQEYDAQTMTLVDTPHTPLPFARADFGSVIAQGSRRFNVVGGVDQTGADQSTVFEYNPFINGPIPGPPGTPSGTWVNRGNMSRVRRGLGVSSPPAVTNFLPVRNSGRDRRMDAIALWIENNVRSSRAPVSANDSAAINGKQLFNQTGLVVPGFSCATCHGGSRFTRSIVDYSAPPSPDTGLGLGNERVIGEELRQTLTQGGNAGQQPGVLINVGTFTLGGGRKNEIRSNSADISQAIAPLGANGFNIPSLLSVHETAPYFHSGLAQTLEEVLNGAHDSNGGTRHHFVANAQQRSELISFLRSIEDTTAIFPRPNAEFLTVPCQVASPSPSPSPSPEWQPVVLTAPQIGEIKAWTVGGRTSVYVRPKFPDAGYRIVSWGIPTRAGNDFTVDASVEKFTGTSIQAIVTTAQIYDLGPLADGVYNFNFKTSGTLAKTLQFTVGGAAPPPNPIDDQRQFVRRQYLDFLNREPDGPGWDFWTDNITKCSDPNRRPPLQTEPECISRQRETTSAAFFISPEFQNTGYFVLRVYRGSLGRYPYFGGSVPPDANKDEFTRDHATVSAGIVVNNQLDAGVINSNKLAFVNQFVTRAEFLAIYGALNNTQYVDKLFQTTGVTPTAPERSALIDGLSNTTETKASVLFKIVDGTQTVTGGGLQFQTRYGQLFYEQQFNPAFVQMEYFGYMRRDPDAAGYAFWLSKLTQFGGNFVNAEMVLAFILSPEYRARFGQP